jgi:hypothetical protein
MTKMHMFKQVLENFQFYLDKITDFTKNLAGVFMVSAKSKRRMNVKS